MEKDNALLIVLKSGHKIELGPVTLGIVPGKEDDLGMVMHQISMAKERGDKTIWGPIKDRLFFIDPQEIAYCHAFVWSTTEIVHTKDGRVEVLKKGGSDHLRPADPGPLHDLDL